MTGARARSDATTERKRILLAEVIYAACPDKAVDNSHERSVANALTKATVRYFYKCRSPSEPDGERQLTCYNKKQTKDLI